MGKVRKILIVGAGLLGTSAAFRLAQAGAEVTVLETAHPAAGASGMSFGWINASFYLNPAHHRLRVHGMAAHHRLQADLPGYRPDWQGTLWWEDEGPGFDATLAALSDLGYPARALTRAEVAAQVPALRTLPTRALSFPSETATDAAALTRTLLAASGATLLTGAAEGLTTRGSRITGVQTAQGPVLADHVLLAAGTGTPALLRSIGLDLPMVPRPGLILRTQPVSFRLNHILVSPAQEIRQVPDGGLLAPCAANHQADASETVADPQAAIQATLANLGGLFGPVTAAATHLAHRPVPADGLPVLGRVTEGLSLAVMHSGVTLAALAAEGVTAEILREVPDPLWADYRPARLVRQT